MVVHVTAKNEDLIKNKGAGVLRTLISTFQTLKGS